jgi:hypothetical protein
MDGPKLNENLRHHAGKNVTDCLDFGAMTENVGSGTDQISMPMHPDALSSSLLDI